jgi:hypothetical protein
MYRMVIPRQPDTAAHALLCASRVVANEPVAQRGLGVPAWPGHTRAPGLTAAVRRSREGWGAWMWGHECSGVAVIIANPSVSGSLSIRTGSAARPARVIGKIMLGRQRRSTPVHCVASYCSSVC